MSPHNELMMLLLANAHCTLKAAYLIKGIESDDNKIQKVVLDAFDFYADSDLVPKRLRPSEE
jgi:hypothetical protein